MNELLPCPFCGEYVDAPGFQTDGEMSWFVIQHEKCNLFM